MLLPYPPLLDLQLPNTLGAGTPTGTCLMCPCTPGFPQKVAEAEFPSSPEDNSGGSMLDSKLSLKGDKTWVPGWLS